MADPRRATCRLCGRHRDEVGLISWGGYCGDCYTIPYDANNDAIHTRSGPAYERWRYSRARELLGSRVALALKQAGVFGPEFLDEVLASEQTAGNGSR